MYGSVPFTNDGQGSFDFATATGTYSGDSSLGFTFSSNMVPTTGNFTFSCWIKNPNDTVGQVGLFSNAGGGDGYRFGVGTNGIYFLIGPTYTESTIGFQSAISEDTWNNVVAIFNRNALFVSLYLNGIYQGQQSIPSNQTSFQTNPPGLVRSACCQIYTGKLANFSVYNRDLIQQEIQQNYQQYKTRFNL